MRLIDAYEKVHEKEEIFDLEVYRLTLSHYYISKNGDRYTLDEPLTIQYANLDSNHSLIFLNDMFEKLREAFLKKLEEEKSKYGNL